jgi:hypothetical protein
MVTVFGYQRPRFACFAKAVPTATLFDYAMEQFMLM